MPSQARVVLFGIVALAVGLAGSGGAAAEIRESGNPSGLLVRYRTQRLEPREVAECPPPGVGMECFASVLPLKSRRHLRLRGGGGSIWLRSDDRQPSPTAEMETRSGRRLGPRLQVVAVDRGRRATDGPLRPGGPVAHYTEHRRWRISLPRRLPQGLYMIAGDFSYPLGGFSSFAFGVTNAT